MTLLTTRDVCYQLGISRSTLQRLRRHRKIGYVTLGYRSLRFRQQDVDRFISRRQRAVKYAESQLEE